MGNRHREIDFDKETFLAKWHRCSSWLECGPDSYNGKYYIKRWGDESTDPLEQIQITQPPDDIQIIIQMSWELAIGKTHGKINENTVQIFSEELHYELPFRNRKNADEYYYLEWAGESAWDSYLNSFNPSRTLKNVFDTNEANCVAHALAIKEIIPDKRFQIFNNYYDYTKNPDLEGKIGVHTILAKLENGSILAIDSSEGPIAHKDKYNPFMYKMSLEHFAKNYIPSCIRGTCCSIEK